jgi:hypothetical protein
MLALVKLNSSQLPETRDPKTGEVVRYNEDDDTTTLGDMLRQERFGAGMADQKETDSELARAIMSDGRFQVRQFAYISAFQLKIIACRTT